MSKQSKQERAQKYAKGASEAVRLANIAADAARKEIAGLSAQNDNVRERLDAIHQWLTTAKAEIAEIDATLDGVHKKEIDVGKLILNLEDRVNGAKGTLLATSQRIHTMLAEVPAE